MSPEQSTAKLLNEVFAADELRRALHAIAGDELDSSLPGGHLPAAELAHQAVIALRRRGLLSAFLAYAAELRPARRDEIIGIAGVWSASRTNDPGRAPPPQPQLHNSIQITGVSNVVEGNQLGDGVTSRRRR